MLSMRLWWIYLAVAIISTNADLYKYSHWKLSNISLPRAEKGVATSYYNNSIILFGGDFNGRQMVEYNVVNTKITDKGINMLSKNISGLADFYTQVNDKVYFIDDTFGESNIIVYNLKNRYFENNIAINEPIGQHGCLTSTTHLLFLVGGYDYGAPQLTQSPVSNVLQIYNLSSDNWLANAPSMKHARYGHSCIIHPSRNTLYAIGGLNFVEGHIKQVEKLSIDSFVLNTWEYTSGKLLQHLFGSRTTIIDDLILVIGGRYADGDWKWMQQIQIIDCNTGKIFYGPYLKYPVSDAGVIQIHNIIYAFAGENTDLQNNSLTTMQYVNLDNAPAFNGSASYGVNAAIIFEYEVSENVTTLSQEIIHVIVSNNVANECVVAEKYDNEQNGTVVNATVVVCDKLSQDTLIVVFNNTLHTELIRVINNKTNLLVNTDFIYLQFDKIGNDATEQEVIVSTRTLSIQTTNYMQDIKDPSNDGTNYVLIIVFIGCILLCIGIIVYAFCIYKRNKWQKRIIVTDNKKTEYRTPTIEDDNDEIVIQYQPEMEGDDKTDDDMYIETEGNEQLNGNTTKGDESAGSLHNAESGKIAIPETTSSPTDIGNV